MSKIDELVLRVKKDPSDADARLVLADAWMEAGDPRGELAQVQHARATAKGAKQKELASREKELVKELRKSLLGKLAVSEAELVFELGALDRLIVSAPDKRAEEVIRKVCGSDAAFMLRTIELRSPEREASTDALKTLFERLEKKPAALSDTFERLVLGNALETSSGDRVFDYFDFSFTDDVSRALAAFPGARELDVDLGMANLAVGPFESDVLRSFRWIGPYIASDWLAPLAESKLPALERFVLWTGAMVMVNTEDELYGEGEDEEDEGYGGYDEESGVDLEQLGPVLAMLDACERLRTFGLCSYRGDVEELIGELGERRFFKRLRELDLTRTHLGPREAKALFSALAKTKIERVVVDLAPEIRRPANVEIVPPQGPKGTFRYVVTQE